MKRITVFLFALAMTFTLCSCGNVEKEKEEIVAGYTEIEFDETYECSDDVTFALDSANLTGDYFRLGNNCELYFSFVNDSEEACDIEFGQLDFYAHKMHSYSDPDKLEVSLSALSNETVRVRYSVCFTVEEFENYLKKYGVLLFTINEEKFYIDLESFELGY
ncbi:MAG: hypothetical protein IJX66_02155 [Lachnospiraceae bacterium]|nr:hypothetical protein [Lachnospiraceae bacterium]